MFKEVIAEMLVKPAGMKKEELIGLIETPKQEMGDYAFPCFAIAGRLRKNPAEIAEDISSKLKLPKEIERIAVLGAYINFFISKKALAEKVLQINNDFGKGRKKEKIILEHTSVNPNASPHVGRARNSITGDAIKRILQFEGHEVETHYYVNDVSKQIAMLALNFKAGDGFNDLLKKYVEISKKAEKNPDVEKKAFELLSKFEHKDKQTTEMFNRIVDTAIKGQKEIFDSMDIKFDYFDYESKYIEQGKEILEQLKKTGKIFEDKEGRIVLDQKETGLGVKMKSPVLVLARSNGTGLYPLRDLAYASEKCKKARSIIVLGEDQKLYFEQIKNALILLKKPYPEVVHYSFVLLKDIGKMSTRSGELVLLEEFIDEATKKAQAEIKKRKTKGDALKIGIGAIKYAMLRNENNKNIMFDWNQALNFEGDSGPYLQYSYARACSILRKAKPKSAENAKAASKTPELEEKEAELIKLIIKFPEAVEDAYKKLSPHIIANYALQLAQMFNEFYHSSKVIGSEQEAFRLKVVEAFCCVMKNALFLMGIDALEKM